MDSHSPTELPPFNIPDHELIRCIGRGAYGEVWLAQNIMGIYRAVKIVHRHSFDNARPFERELAGIRRYEPVSRSHDGFVDVLHIGQNKEKDSFYYVMELGDDRVSGQQIDPETYAPKTLAREISKHGKLSYQECLQLALGLTKALAALHKSGLVHRDIKPSNIIFVLGAPKLADIGLVAGIDEAKSFVGTEGYIAPEGPGGTQADIFSLGKVLYEAATGKDREDFPELPTLWDQAPELNSLLELNEVIIRACASDATKRYRTADDMYADLVLLSSGKSLRRLRVLERRFANIKRVARLSLIGTVALAMLIFQGYREWKNVIESRKRQVLQSVKAGTQALESGNLLSALRNYADGLQLDQGNAERELPHRVRYRNILDQCPKLIQFWLANGEVTDVTFNSDGNKVLVAEANGKLKMFDLGAPNLPPVSLGSGHYSSVAYGANDSWILATGGTISLWNTNNLGSPHSLPNSGWVNSGRFSPDGTRFVTGCEDNVASVWNTLTEQREFSLVGHTNGVRFAAFSPNGKWIVTTSEDGTAALWDAADGHWIRSYPHNKVWVTYAAFSPDSETLVTACNDRRARVWETKSGKQIRPDLRHNDVVDRVEYSPDGRLILTACMDGTVHLWRSDNLEALTLNADLAHSERVTSAAFDPTGRKIVVACLDGSVRVWDLAGAISVSGPRNRSYSGGGKRFLTISNDSITAFDAITELPVNTGIKAGGHVEYIAQNRTGQFVLAVSTNQSSGVRIAQVLTVATGDRVGPPITIPSSVKAAALNDDGSRFAILDGNTADVREVSSGTSLFPPLRPAASVLFSPDGLHVATWAGNTVQVWDAKTGKPSFAGFQMNAGVTCVEFSPNGAYLAASCADDQINKLFAQVWNMTTGKTVGPQLRHGDGVSCISFSPDNKHVVTGGEDKAAMVWEFTKGQLVFPPMRHPWNVTAVAYSPDGKWIVSICKDSAVRVWNAANGEPLTPPLRHPILPVQATFLPGALKVVTADSNGSTWLWDLSPVNGPVDDLALLSRFVSGDSLRAPSDTSPQQPEEVKAIWDRLRTNFPPAFTVSSNQVVAWHELQAQQSEKGKDWFAAAFHWKQLLNLLPNDSGYAERLQYAERKLQEPKSE
jgi:WD40 repeat protein